MAEVLVRMREEERALLPPGEFLPVFEHYGMMPQLDRWVRAATRCSSSRAARASRASPSTSRARRLQDAEFPGFVAAELRAAGIAMDAVLFEIDESDVLGAARVRGGASPRRSRPTAAAC